MPSTYDVIHDKYFTADTTKPGTRYERLVAYVLKAIDTSSNVVHDIRLRGNSDVSHQIDVSIKTASGDRRILIECKDFDKSSDKVGLGIIRDFASVVDDTSPDEAFVITCVGFTKNASKFAKHKGIKLATLREFTLEDAAGRIQKIVVNFEIQTATPPNMTISIGSEEAQRKFVKDAGEFGVQHGVSKTDPIFLNLPGKRVQITEYAEQIWKGYPKDNPGPVDLRVPLPGSTLEVENRGGIQIDGLILTFDVVHHSESMEVVSNKIAQLILEGFKGKDIVIFDEQLQRLSIDEETGEISV